MLWRAIEAGLVVERVKITPTQAKIMLEINTHNLPIRDSLVEKYADAMRRGYWRYTRQPIIITKDGVIQDGQHRLRGIVKSNVPCQFDLAFGADPDDFAYIDTGRTRVAGDIFAMHGVKNAKLMASAVRWIEAYRSNTISIQGSQKAYTSAELYEIYLTMPNLQESAHHAGLMARSKLAPKSPMCAMHYLCAQKDRDQANSFFSAVATGEGLVFGDPALALRNHLVMNLASERRISTRKIAALTVRAWNRMRQGETAKMIRWAEGDPFPKIL